MLDRYINYSEETEISLGFKLGSFLGETLPTKLSAYRHSRLLNKEEFYIPERNVYNLIVDLIEIVIPFPNAILIENLLYKIPKNNNSYLRTDIAIKHIKNFRNNRKEQDTDFLYFIEVKTIFEDEVINTKQIEEDLKKLADCYEYYKNSICLFILISTEEGIEKLKKDDYTKNLIEKEEEISYSSIKLKKTANNRKGENEDFYIYIFNVTSTSSDTAEEPKIQFKINYEGQNFEQIIQQA